jgi:hypothetical protein
MSENKVMYSKCSRVLRRIFGPEREKIDYVIGILITVHNASYNWGVKSVDEVGGEHSTQWDMHNKILVTRLERKKHLEGVRVRGMVILKWILKISKCKLWIECI